MSPRLKVLLVDDDPAIRHVFGKLLQGAGYDVQASPDAEDALSKLGGGPVDLVLSDISMPGLSGLDLLAHLRSRQLDCEVILMTGFASVESAIRALREGAFDYLVKPVKQGALFESLARAEEKLTHTRRRREALALLETGLRQMTGRDAPTGSAPQGIKSELAKGGRYCAGPVVLDLDRFVIEVDGQPIDATPSEIEILHYFCKNPGRVIAPQELVQSIRGYSIDAWEAREMIRPHISNLRRKMLAVSPEADVIVTIRTVGYMLRAAEAKGSGRMVRAAGSGVG